MNEIMSIVYDIILREPKLMWKHYNWDTQKQPARGSLILCADGNFPHGGMFDRLKGAISVYAASKVLGRDFRINFTSPFQLEKYLEPNEYDWRLKEGEYTENIWTDRLIFMYGEWKNPYRLLKTRKKNAHFYYGYDSLDYINKKCGTSFVWGDLYRELFKPTAYLQKYIDAEKEKIGKDYIAIHLRFMNLLGDKTEFDCDPVLPLEKQKVLRENALQAIRKVTSKNQGCKIMLATDSANFVEFVKNEIPDLYTVPGEIRHIGTAGETSDGANIKMFLDYYMISGAKKVYNLVGQGMWKSAFPEYAAKIGGCEFERIIY